MALARLDPNGQYLFPSPTNPGRSIDPHALAVAMARFAKRIDDKLAGAATWKAEPPTPHDLRRTVSTRLAELGIAKEDRDAVLNHTPQDVGKRHYDLYDRGAEKRSALTKWSNVLDSILRTAPVSNDANILRNNSNAHLRVVA
jgi:integrase